MNTTNTQHPDDGSKEYRAGLEANLDGKHNEAIAWYTKAADKGHTDAMNRLGNIYQNGNNVAQDYTIARQWYVKAGNKERIAEIDRLIAITTADDGEEEYRAGNEALDYGEHAKAAEYFTKAAAKGNTSAMNYLGHAYKHGTGVAQNYAEAIKWYTCAANNGHKIAMKSLGEMYENGLGVAKNYVKAREYYVKSGSDWCVERIDRFIAETSTNTAPTGTDDGEEEFRAGKEAYDHKEYEKAADWFAKAAIKGHTDGIVRLADAYHEGEGVAQNYAKARELYNRAVANGSTEAMFSLGYIYEKGIGIAIDYDKAREYYVKAGDELCVEQIDRIIAETSTAGGSEEYRTGIRAYFNGEYEKAADWFAKAAIKGHTDGIVRLADAYHEGVGVARNYAKARKLYNRAVANGSTEAMVSLGYIYEKGIGIAIDYDKAREYYVKAGDELLVEQIDRIIRESNSTK